MKTKHSEEKEFKCKECNYGTNYKRDLNRHIKLNHSMRGAYNCYPCHYSTNIHHRYIRYIRDIHSSWKRHNYKLCKYKTNLGNHLESNMKKDVHLKDLDMFIVNVETILLIQANILEQIQKEVKYSNV